MLPYITILIRPNTIGAVNSPATIKKSSKEQKLTRSISKI